MRKLELASRVAKTGVTKTMTKWSKLAEAGEKSQQGARHLRRKMAALLAKGVPAMKKEIRRNKQRKKK